MVADRSPLASAAFDLQSFMQSEQWAFCFIGGLANAYWGEPRYTEDADVSLLTGFGNEERFIAQLLRRFQPRRDDAADFALRSRVLLLRHENGVALDIGLAAFPYEESAVGRAVLCLSADEFNGLRICSAEDFIIYKAFAGRERDWVDIDGVLRRQRKLQLALVKAELPWLLEIKADDQALLRVAALAQKYGHEW